MKKVVLLSLLCCSLFSCNKEQVSPNGKITLTYSNENQSHSFHLTYTDAQGKHDVLNLPAIGLLTANGGGKNLELKSISDAQAIGTVTQCSETGHAVGLACGETEILVHAGIDTVQMAGRGFSLSVKPGENVKTGQPLLVMDAAMVRASGYSPVVVTIVTDTPGKVSFSDKTEIHGGETLFTVSLP